MACFFLSGGADVLVLCASGLLVVADPMEERSHVSVELDLAPLALLLLPGARCCAVLGRRALVTVTLAPGARSGAAVAASLLRHVADAPLACAACAPPSAASPLLHVAPAHSRALLMFGVRPLIPDGLDRLRAAETTRSLTQMEEDERRRREENAQRYVQRKGLMLNLSENKYTESSKPMGLDFEMEGALEDQVALAPVPEVRVTGTSSPSSKAKVCRALLFGACGIDVVLSN